MLVWAEHFDAAAAMVDLALERVNGDDTKTRIGVQALPTEILSSLEEAAHKDASLATYHAGKLPTEIFGEIFSILTDEGATQAILVSHVCSHWRLVALNTPSLWRILVLVFSSLSNNLAEKTKVWKERAGGNIRELCVRIKLFEGDMGLQVTTVLQDMLWDRLQICRFERVPTDIIANVLDGLSMRHILSSLIGLDLFSLGLGDLRTLTVDNLGLSQLRNLTICKVTFSWNMIFTYNLVSLVIMEPNILRGGSPLDILQANPMLEVLVLDNVEPPDTTPRFTLFFISSHPSGCHRHTSAVLLRHQHAIFAHPALSYQHRRGRHVLIITT